MLAGSTMPIKEIAYELNFETAGYFITFFKAKTGVSPKVYREQVHSSPNE